MLKNTLLLVGAAVAFDNFEFNNERSFNESCNALTEASVCEGKCTNEYSDCIRECAGAEDEQECRQLCNRDQTTCFDRCPCHDKCSWGCPCGFYQCAPNCNYVSDEEYARQCGEACIEKGDIHVGICMGGSTTEDECYKQGNLVSLECMDEECPCYENCPSCSQRCSDWCPDEPSEVEKCEAVWGGEEAACMEECDKPRIDCYDACDTGVCKDECDQQWIERERCCHTTCPCHGKCPNGCPCYGDWECGDPEVNGRDFCPQELPEPDKDCLDEYADLVAECIRPCVDESYGCTLECDAEDQFCLRDCKVAESLCKSHCPCYYECPNGCPCPGWCGSLPCNQIWPDERDCCEDKCEDKWDTCKDTCTGADPELCRDDCLEDYVECYDSCPCHTECRNGCPCNNELTASNGDCCANSGIDHPELDDCELIWGDEVEDCRDHCSASTQMCMNACQDDNTECIEDCRETNRVCVSRCPCFKECPNGCPCPIWEDHPNFCPIGLPDPWCTQKNKDEIEECLNFCHDINYKCIAQCDPDSEDYDDCRDICQEEAEDCPKNCPCFENCPDGCPCATVEVDCPNRSVFGQVKDDIDFVWCKVWVDPDPDWSDPHCELLWQEEIYECNLFCASQESSCRSRCNNDQECFEKCSIQRTCCEFDCPCNEHCIGGCPCRGVECPGGTCVCPELITFPECLENWSPQANHCVFDCVDNSYNCVDDCKDDYDCYNDCKDAEIDCLNDCPCHLNCENGCDVGDCPTWDKYCPATTPKPSPTTTTQPATTTAITTIPIEITTEEVTVEVTTAETTTIEDTPGTTTTQSGGGPIGPTAPPIGKPEGDMLLILSDDKSMLHNWPKGSPQYFFELQSGHTDFNSRFDFNGYWVKDACSVQFQGESYLIGGAYSCASGDSTCNHINVQKSVVKLSNDKCGLDIIWDGYNNKLPYDMKEHSCAAFNKRIGSGNTFQEHVMICAPDETADDTNNDKVSIERFCWSSRYMTTNEMYWQREPTLTSKHLKAVMVQHKGRVHIIGGTGKFTGDSQDSSNSVEWLNQNAHQNEDGSFGDWVYGEPYPIVVEQSAVVSTESYIYLFGGLSYDEEFNPITDDAAEYNTALVYKNQNPSEFYSWVRHGELLRPRGGHKSVVMDGQVFHCAGYAKDYTDPNGTVVNGRRVEKWEELDGDANKLESDDKLFRYTSPQVFIVNQSWYNKCSK